MRLGRVTFKLDKMVTSIYITTEFILLEAWK